MNMKIIKILITILLVTNSSIYAQDELIDDLSQNQDSTSLGLITEKIETISNNRKIFIVTSNSNGFNEGDFISLLTNNELICRALVAKIKNNKAGIKIVKLYAPILFKDLKISQKIQIIRGDDSYFKNKKKKVDSPEGISKFNDEEDLLSEDIIDEGSTVKEKKGALITTDNIVSINYTSSSKINANLIGLTWSYQVKKNFWTEAVVNVGTENNAKIATGIDIQYFNLIVRAKYTIQAPAYSFIQPYLGFSMVIPTSPDSGNLTIADKAIFDSKNSKSFVGGATLLKRLVPGWFLRANLSTIGVGIGMALEF